MYRVGFSVRNNFTKLQGDQSEFECSRGVLLFRKLGGVRCNFRRWVHQVVFIMHVIFQVGLTMIQQPETHQKAHIQFTPKKPLSVIP